MTAFLGNILGKLMMFVYNAVSSIGAEPENLSFYAMSIIVTTIIFKLLLLPLGIKQSKSTKMMGKLQPKLQEIQEKYKNDPKMQQIKMAELYKQYNYNPASGCLLLIIQLPIMIAFYRVIQNPVTFAFTDPAAYDAMNKSFFWITNLENPDPLIWGLPLLAGITTYLQTIVMQPPTQGNTEIQSTQNTMNIVMPVMIFIMARKFPAGLALYWVVSNGFTVLQYILINKLGNEELKED